MQVIILRCPAKRAAGTVEDIITVAPQIGLTINVTKTIYMTNGK